MSKRKPIIILADNGSTKASATLQLRSIAKQLSERVHQDIYPVSLQHADVISADELGGMKASVLRTFLREQLALGEREFIIVPLFFGNSRALTKFIPDLQRKLEEECGEINITVKDTLYQPSSDYSNQVKEKEQASLAQIIADHILQTSKVTSTPLENIVLVDHGSPSPKITAVRNGVADDIQVILSKKVEQAAMERRTGKQYDFNGDLLEDWLITKAKQSVTGKKINVIVALMFSLPGRHAGDGGDIVTICNSVTQRYPNFKVAITPLVGEHPLLLDILVNRLNA